MKKENKNSNDDVPDNAVHAGAFLRKTDQFEKNQFAPHEFDVTLIELEIQMEELKLANKRAEMIAKKYAALYDSAPSAFFTLEQDGNIKGINLSGAKLLGKDRKHLISNNFKFFIAPDDLPVFNDFFAKIIESNCKQTCQIKLAIPKQPVLNVYLEGSVSDNEHAYFLTAVDITDLVSMIGTIQDITARKTKDELVVSDEKFRLVFENNFDGMVIYEEHNDLSQRKLIDCNEQYAAMAGIPREELLNYKSTNDIPVLIEKSTDEVRIESLSKEKSFQGSYSWIRPDGKVNIIEFKCMPVRWQGKLYTIGIHRDVTEQRHIEAELIAAKEKAEESDRLKSTFLSNMSHEIRTPLNSIIGFSDLLLDPFFGEQHAEFAGYIKENGQNLLTILTDIMDISKIEAGQINISKDFLSVHKIITDIHKEFLCKAIEKGIDLKLDLGNHEKEIIIVSDEFRLKQILVNLVGNAIKFTEKGYIAIGITLKGDLVQFVVSDTGIGIPKEFQEQVFERFLQLETAYTRKYGGNGLGLAISKSLVELLGGSIWMESEPGKGSTFHFTIPI